jgi:AraC-like DNA-binding protein
MSGVHRMAQHRSAVRGIEARTLASDRSFPRHSHDQLGIGVILSGAHRSWSGIGHVEAQADDIIMVNPGEMHDGMPIGGVREWRMLYFDPPLVAGLAADEDTDECEVVRPTAHDPALAERFGRLFAAVTTSQPEPLQLEERLLGLVMHVLRGHGLRRPSPLGPSPSVASALARLDADPASRVTLAELAELSGVSRFQLLRAFAREIGVTPHAYLVQRRVRLTRQLLASGQPIVEAAITAGFADQSHMTRAFVRQFGITPGRYLAASAETPSPAILESRSRRDYGHPAILDP